MTWCDEAEAGIERRAADLREWLAGIVLAEEAFDGSRPGSGVTFRMPARSRLPVAHPIVAKYADHFRPLTAREIDRELASSRRRWRFVAGLP